MLQGWKKTALITGSSVLIMAMVAVWVWVDLDTAAQVATVIAGVVGVAGLTAGLVGPRQQAPPVLRATRTGRATARGGGVANTGISGPAAAPPAGAVAEDTGDAEADGGTAGTGVQLH
ncbi:hypothetical protein [Streptomyces sp. NPDC018031]|uniref:hypothetical protein n=1 Tax=Streptomyces sp. NPDC018031 TaxID=3365033 RepID=UPI0037908A68